MSNRLHLRSVQHDASPTGRQQYLIVNDLQRAKVLEALVQLASQPPGR